MCFFRCFTFSSYPTSACCVAQSQIFGLTLQKTLPPQLMTFNTCDLKKAGNPITNLTTSVVHHSYSQHQGFRGLLCDVRVRCNGNAVWALDAPYSALSSSHAQLRALAHPAGARQKPTHSETANLVCIQSNQVSLTGHQNIFSTAYQKLVAILP